MSTLTGLELDPLEEHLLAALRALEPSTALREAPPEVGEIWRAQVDSRQADYAARWLQQHGRSFYTIGSAGHESNAAVALALRVDDPALLHYRSGAFYLARAAQAEIDGLRDVMLGVVAASLEPIAGGRHKVFGRKELAVIPMTSTIASHLPRAVGMAFAIDRAARLQVTSPWRDDAVVLCSFGDASLNHAAAQAALNTTAQIAYQGLPLPLLFVCEDNGLGISVPSPPGWVESALTAREQIRYEIAYGHDPAEVLGVASELADVGARAASAGSAPPANGALPESCRRGCGDGLSHAAGDSRRLRARPDPRHRALARIGGQRDRRASSPTTISPRATRFARSRSRWRRSRR